MNGKGYGMPSSHAQFLAFFSVSLSLFLLLRHKPPTSYQASHYAHQPLSLPQRVLLSIATIVLAAAVAASRIYLNYHTPLQVGVGCAAGVMSAVGWFGVTEWMRREGWVDRGLDSWLGNMGRLRDLVVEEDLAESGWKVWCEKKEERRRRRTGVLIESGSVGKKTR